MNKIMTENGELIDINIDIKLINALEIVFEINDISNIETLNDLNQKKGILAVINFLKMQYQIKNGE